MFWSQKHIWIGLSRTGQNHARLPANPALPVLKQKKIKKYCLVDLLSLVRR